MTTYLIERLKTYIMEFDNFPNVDEDEKLMVGSIIWEYLIPLVNDPYIMEEQIISFFFELLIVKRERLYNLVIQTIEVHFSSE